MENPSTEPRFLLIGRVERPHGVRGEVRVKAFTKDPTTISEYGPLSTEDGRLLEIERLRPAKDVVVAKFRGVDDRDAAERLNGISLYIDRDRLPPAEEDEFYHADLLGLQAESEAGAPLGTIVAIHNFGAGDILEIAPSRGPSVLLPFSKETVPLVDLQARLVVVALPAETDAREAEEEDAPQ